MSLHSCKPKFSCQPQWQSSIPIAMRLVEDDRMGSSLPSIVESIAGTRLWLFCITNTAHCITEFVPGRVGSEQTNTEQAYCSFVWLIQRVLFICSGSTPVFIVRSVHGPQRYLTLSTSASITVVLQSTSCVDLGKPPPTPPSCSVAQR